VRTHRPLGECLESRVVLSTFKVNSLLDTVAVNLKSGKDASGHITLRSAIMAADAKGGSDTIKVPSGTITLTIAGAGEDAGATGDLDIKGKLKISGKSAGTTIIDGNQLDRVFQVRSGKVSVSNLTIQHGRVVGAGGGGILNSGGAVTWSGVQIVSNTSVGVDGVDGLNGGSGAAGGTGGPGPPARAVGSSTRRDRSRSPTAPSRSTGRSAEPAAMAAPVDSPRGAAEVLEWTAIWVKGGNGGAGGLGSDGQGGGVFNAAGASLTLSGITFSANRAVGGD
jgi:hypothetical protein